MTLRLSAPTIIISGILTGAAAITALSYYLEHRRAANNTAETTTTNRTNRLRRSRHIRLRWNSTARHNDIQINNNTTTHTSDSEEDLDSGKMLSLFKDWGEDDNKNLINLLHAIQENQSRKEGYIHRGITCNKCSVSPIRGTRYKCANCIDFDLCEICEGSNTHVNTHVFLKIRIPIPPLANPRSALLPAFYPGNHHVRSHLPSDKYKQLAHNSHFDQVELEALYEQFKSLSTVDGNEGGIDKETFEQCLGPLGLEKNLIIERIFAFFDRDGDNIISFPEIVAGLSVLCKGNLDEKIEYAFKGYDLDEDGYISRDELYRMYKSYFYLSMELVRDVVSAMEDEMMDTFEFSASQPVSAAFNVAIPSTAVDRNTPTEDESRDDLEAGSSTSTTNTTDNNKVTNKPKPKRYPLKEDYFLRQYEKEAEQVEASANTSNDHLDDLTGTKNGINQQRPNTDPFKPKDPKGKKAWEEKFPIMETMSQGAITEMVDKTFDSIKTEKKGYINFEEFKHCVQIDSSIVSWFEALGTVF